MLITTPRIFGYQITEPIHVSLRTLVYRAVRNLDAQAVVIKILHREYPSFSDLVQFRNQYTISRNLNIDRIIKPYSLEAYQNGYALVMEDYGGISLNKFILENLLTVDQFLRIAIQIADALHQLHTQMVVHKDIKPANILINPSTKQIKLTDFSIASLLPRETQENQITHFLSGTLAYMSPEQTGRMNRGIDYRTDFYSLGVTFYELLTGQLPFQPQDAIELIHCHIAQRPPQIQQLNPQVPSILSDILLKLMAKNAEDRYQSALGLHDDLVTCLDKLESTGEIASFRIGQYDLCDRFCIPEKLYGREQEVQMLLAAFRRVTQGKAELMLVAGFSGIGKTAVVNEVHKPIVEKHGFFIKGKFDQLQRNIPFIAFVKAFRDLIKQLLCEPAEQVCQWQSKILQALGETAQVIVEVIPELENLIGKQPAVLELSGDAAQNRFNRLFQKFVQVFTSESHPLVIFLDDLQWADSGSFKLLELLLDDTEHLLLLGAYRDNEVSSIHPLMLTVEKIRKLGATVNTITLNPLNLANTNQLVADTLNCQGFIVQPLAELIYQKTKGNPFFTSQFLKVLHEDGFIEFNQSVGYWQCDISQIKVRASTDDVVEFMAQQLQKLPRETQNVLQLAACLGAQFDLSTLAIVSKKSEIDTGIALWKALQLGLIVPLNETYKLYQEDDLGEVQTTAPNSQNIQVPYKFLHDRVQQAAYYLIPPHQRSQVHYQIGKLLLQINEPTTREDGIFAIVNQLNYGIELITQESERDQLVELNILALRKARVSVAYQAARDYAQTALNLMGEGGWQRHNETCLILHKLAADLAFICGDLAGMNRLVQVVIDHTKTPLERVEVYLVKMQALAAGRDFAGVVLFGKSIVQEFGVTLLENPTREDIQQALQEVQALIGKRTIEELFHLPKMVDAEKLAITNVLSGMVTACYLSGSPLFSMVVTLQVKLSIQYGNSPMSASGYTFYGILLCNFAQDLIASSEFGHLAYQLAAHPEAKEIRSLTSVLLGMFIFHRTAHLRETVPIFQASHQVGLDTGKLEPAGYNVTAFCINAFWCGYPLVELESQIRAYYQRLVDLNLLSIAGSTRLFWEVVLFLLDNPDNIELSWEQNLHEANLNDPVRLFYFLLHKAILKFWMGDFTQALTNIKQAKNYLVAARSMVLEASLYFYESLIYLNMVNEMGVDLSTHMQDVDLNQAQLQLWAEHAPMNYLHKWQLVAAEKARVLGQKAEAIELYDCAIAQAKQHDYIQEAGLANELASKFYLAWGKEKLAATYMQEAYYCYSRWGAKAKIIHLEQLYPHLLNPILHSTPSEALNLRETLDKISNTSNKTNQLDLITVIKASQALSEEINLDNLLHKLLGVVIENAGAETGYLILHQRENRLLIAAKRTLENPQLVFERVVEYDANEYFPKSIIRYVENTREDIVINDATSEELFIRDPYITKNNVKSVLCTPIIYQGRLLAILYLENSLTIGAFTADKSEILKLLSAQMAISLENAQLYANLEEKVAIRTQELQATLHELKLRQTQLIQTEKMSSLGQIVAGVAHEINNPISFIYGNIGYVDDYLHGLIDLVTFYQQTYPNTTSEIQDFLEKINFNFIQEDAPKILSSMKNGAQRIREIVLTLRNFARLDESGLKDVDIHQGIESTLLILNSRLQAKSGYPTIEIRKNYAQLPKIQCYVAQINQVFMNIFINAIEAIDRCNYQKQQTEGNRHFGVISISTQLLNSDTISISIQDNGEGMGIDVKQKIFDPFFTTKLVGQGVGLGLSISYQIVVDKHHGKLECFSTPGTGTEFLIQLPIQQNSVDHLQ